MSSYLKQEIIIKNKKGVNKSRLIKIDIKVTCKIKNLILLQQIYLEV